MVVGGLGLGYTAVAALEDPRVAWVMALCLCWLILSEGVVVGLDIAFMPSQQGTNAFPERSGIKEYAGGGAVMPPWRSIEKSPIRPF